MTTKELSQLYYLNLEIKNLKKELEDLEAKRGVSAIVIDDMPHGKGPARSMVEQLAAEIVDLKAILHAKQIECIHERNRLERYIAGIKDSKTRQIFEYRFAYCMSWDEVAQRMGDVMEGESARKRCYRYLRETDEKKLARVTDCPA